MLILDDLVSLAPRGAHLRRRCSSCLDRDSSALPGSDRRRLARDRALPGGPHRADAARRRLHGARLHRRARHPRLRRAPALPPARRAARARPGLEGLRALRARLQRALLRAALPRPAHPGAAPVQPAGPLLADLGPLLQHRRVVRRRTRTGSTTPARRRSRTSRRCSAWRCRTSPPPRSGSRCWRPSSAGWPRARRASSGNFYVDLTRVLLYILLPLSVIAGLFLISQGVLRTSAAHAVHDPHRARADARAGPGRLAGGDQAARHQRRRLLQRQLGDAVREPDVAHELRRDADDPRDPGRAHRDLRPHGRQPPPGLGGVRGDDGAVRRRRRARLRRRVHPTPAMDAAGVSGPEPGGQGAALRHRLLLAVRGGHHRRLLRRGERGDGVAHRPRRRGPDERR